MKTSYRGLLAVGCLSVGIAVAVPAMALAQDGPIRVGVTNSLPVGIANTTEPSGFCFDLMNEIAERAGLAVTFVTMNAGEILGALTSGGVDVICSGHGPSNENRAMGIAFTRWA